MSWDLKVFTKAACKKFFGFWYGEMMQLRFSKRPKQVGHEVNGPEGRFGLSWITLPH